MTRVFRHEWHNVCLRHGALLPSEEIMKSIRTLALVTGLLALSGVSQAQFSSTWTAVSDYDFRGYSQSATAPALHARADYAFGDTGLAIGAWASNVDFGNDEDAELDLYVN